VHATLCHAPPFCLCHAVPYVSVTHSFLFVMPSPLFLSCSLFSFCHSAPPIAVTQHLLSLSRSTSCFCHVAPSLSVMHTFLLCLLISSDHLIKDKWSLMLNFEYVQRIAYGKLDRCWRRRHSNTKNKTLIGM